MANCPNCGSSHIQLKRETNVNWGRAITGLVLFGFVGGAIGAITGADRNVNACLDCGTSWKASDLHNILLLIKNFANITPDLTKEKDRLFVNRFMLEIVPCIENIDKIEKESVKIFENLERKKVELVLTGYVFGGFTLILLFINLANYFVGASWFVIPLIIPTILVCIGMLTFRINKKSVEQKIENTRKERVRIKLSAENVFRLQMKKLIDRYER